MNNNETLRMTHNEYMEFLKNNASRLYTDKGYSMADYNRDADRVEIIGFDLDRFGFDEKTRGFIDKVFSGAGEDKFGNLRLDGNVMDNALAFTIAGELGCELVKDKFYSGFFKNDEKRCVLEYCEGDIYLTLCETDERYQEAVEDYERFYGVRPEKAEVLFDELEGDATANVIEQSELQKIFEEIKQHIEDVGFSSFGERFEFNDWLDKLQKKYIQGCGSCEKGSLDEQIRDAETVAKEKVSENKEREVCKVTFIDSCDQTIDVYLDIVPEEYKREKDGFLLTADERCLAYDKAAEIVGEDRLSSFVIYTAEIVKVSVGRKKDSLQER